MEHNQNKAQARNTFGTAHLKLFAAALALCLNSACWSQTRSDVRPLSDVINLSYEAFSCAAFEVGPAAEEQREALLTVAFEEGRRFLRAAREQGISEEDVKTMYLGVVGALGPRNEADKKNSNGLIVDPATWTNSDDVLLARLQYYATPQNVFERRPDNLGGDKKRCDEIVRLTE